MLICQQCQCLNPDGTVMCNQCFVPLPVALAAAPVQVAAPQPAHHVRWTVIENLQPTGPRLELPDLAYQGEILLGRTDLANQIIVDVDLAALGGYDQKVSRRHAKLIFHQSKVTIEDWGSAHGTYVNKERLLGQERRELQSGDEIRLANLVFKMEVV